MIRLVLIVNLIWIFFFCVAKPQTSLKDGSPDAFQTSPDVPKNGAILAGVMTSMWTINEQDIGYLVVINDYKHKQLVRQSACVRNHLLADITDRVLVSCRVLFMKTFFLTW